MDLIIYQIFLILFLSLWRESFLAVKITETMNSTIKTSFRQYRNHSFYSEETPPMKKVVDFSANNSSIISSFNPTAFQTQSPFQSLNSTSPTYFISLSPSTVPSQRPSSRSPRWAPSRKPTNYRTISPSRIPSNIPTLFPTLPSKIPTIFPTELPTDITTATSSAPLQLNSTLSLICAQFQITVTLNNYTYTDMDPISIAALINATAVSIGISPLFIAYISDEILSHQSMSRDHFHSIAATLKITNPRMFPTISESNISTLELMDSIQSSFTAGVFAANLYKASQLLRASNLSDVSVDQNVFFSSVQFTPVDMPSQTPTSQPTLQTPTVGTTSYSPTILSNGGGGSGISATDVLRWPLWMSITVLVAAFLLCVLVIAIIFFRFFRNVNVKVHVYSVTQPGKDDAEDDANNTGNTTLLLFSSLGKMLKLL